MFAVYVGGLADAAATSLLVWVFDRMLIANQVRNKLSGEMALVSARIGIREAGSLHLTLLCSVGRSGVPVAGKRAERLMGVCAG